jgi:hypothetical protein
MMATIIKSDCLVFLVVNVQLKEQQGLHGSHQLQDQERLQGGAPDWLLSQL